MLAEDPDEALEQADFWRTEGAVLCVAGRGPLDEAASTPLVDVLRKHGFGAVVVPYGSVTRGRAGNIDALHAKLACVTHLELEGAPAHLRYLLLRLRNALPPVTVVAGLWPPGDPIRVRRQKTLRRGRQRRPGSTDRCRFLNDYSAGKNS